MITYSFFPPYSLHLNLPFCATVCFILQNIYTVFLTVYIFKLYITLIMYYFLKLFTSIKFLYFFKFILFFLYFPLFFIAWQSFALMFHKFKNLQIMIFFLLALYQLYKSSSLLLFLQVYLLKVLYHNTLTLLLLHPPMPKGSFYIPPAEYC